MSMKLAIAAAVTALAVGVSIVPTPTHAAEGTKMKTVVLVHGGFVDGSGWEGVYEILRKDGYPVTIVQNPTISLDDDVAVTKRAIAAAPVTSFLSAIHMVAWWYPKPVPTLKSRAWYT